MVWAPLAVALGASGSGPGRLWQWPWAPLAVAHGTSRSGPNASQPVEVRSELIPIGRRIESVVLQQIMPSPAL